ncbi:MAG: hypothetical protein AAB972_00340 [Patescibacteria group bacterium]
MKSSLPLYEPELTFPIANKIYTIVSDLLTIGSLAELDILLKIVLNKIP